MQVLVSLPAPPAAHAATAAAAFEEFLNA